MSRFRLFPAVTLLLAAALAPAQTKDLQTELSELRKEVEAKRKETNVAGLGLAIVKDGKIIFSEGFGYKDVEKKTKVTADTQFAIGSSTKAFVSMLTAMSGDEGKIQFTDPPRKWIPYFHLYDPTADEKMTMSDLLSHRVGLPRTDILWATGKLSREDILWAIGKVHPTAPFGTKWQYQNVMFAVVGEALQAAHGEPWEQLAREKILGPLHMTNTNLSVAEMQKSPDYALGYTYSVERHKFIHLPMRDIPAVSAAGAINSSVNDMAKWVNFMIAGGQVDGKQLVSKERFDELTKERSTVNSVMKYGYGWFLQKWNGKQVVHHGGNIDGFTALVGYMPEEKVGFVALSNANISTLPNAVMDMVWRHVVGGSAKPEAPAAAAPANTFKAVKPEQEVGVYRFAQANLDFKVTLEGGTLKLQPTGQPKFDLIPVSERRYKAAPPAPDNVFIEFRQSKEDPKVVEAQFEQAGQKILLKKPEPFKADISVEDLMAKLIDATGGEKAIRSLQTLRTRYVTDMENQGVTIYGITVRKSPGLSSDVSIFKAAGRRIATAQSTFDGKVAVDESDFSPREVKEGAERGDFYINSLVVPELDWKEHFASVTITGMDKVGDVETYVVELKPKLGTLIKNWVSKKDFRVLKRQTGSGVGLGTEVYEDYRPVNGVLLPYKTVRDSAFYGRVVTTVEAYEPNIGAPDSMFKVSLN